MNIKFEVQKNGNLKISLNKLNDEEKEYIADFRKQNNSTEDFLWEIFESYFCNGYHLVPEQHKGLTEAPMISEDLFITDETTQKEIDGATMWGFLSYMVQDPIEVLLKEGSVVFTKI